MAPLVLGLLAASGPLVFGDAGGTWLVLQADGEVRRLSDVAGIKPADLATSRDSRRWAVVNGQALSLVEGAEVKRTLALPKLRIEAPEFSTDGAWVFFSARDESEIPHTTSMNFAQLWRVRFERGEPEKLTNTPGCHQLPKALPDGRVLFTHSSCSGGRVLELLDVARKKELRAAPNLGEVRESAATADGKRLVFSRLAPFGLEVLELTLSDASQRRLGLVQVEGARQRLAWDRDEKSVLFQDRGTVWRLKPDGTTEAWLPIAEASR